MSQYMGGPRFDCWMEDWLSWQIYYGFHQTLQANGGTEL